ncbi:contractile injection system protein, VgrG/Pvc8 family [Burkholderia cepacia]|uniref:contractile injection system protein, VgrG/Pvc8 family n=1 Tax=Burkholderia cepacia TaxID=292 RepID=UPI000A98F59E|nr:contractile injection system protein, VgrG/Pvc8 family [Burkholderia cepacia]
MVDRTDLNFTFTIGDESFEVVEFTLHEGLSETFLLQVELASANPAIDFGEVLDRNGLLTIWQGGQPVRYVHGAISSFVQRDTGFRRTRYSAVVEPRLARLKLSSDWRIFQTLSVPEIATAVLKAHHQTLDYEQRVTNEHLAREYCVQAGDTDYDFIERILREEGFFYAFPAQGRWASVDPLRSAVYLRPSAGRAGDLQPDARRRPSVPRTGRPRSVASRKPPKRNKLYRKGPRISRSSD